MSVPSVICSDCGATIEDWQAHCVCGKFAGFPNYRQALAERGDLLKRSAAAHANATARGVASLLVKLEALAEQSRPVISISFSTCYDIMQWGKYRNYNQMLSTERRDPSSAQDHSNRSKVGHRFFPGYAENIQYAALSPDGRGLSNYGAVAVQLDLTRSNLDRRLSLLEENSFAFYDRHDLGRLNATSPSGYRAVWEDRAKLVGAKLAQSLTPSIDESTLRDLILRSGNTRDEDDFIEVAIFSDRGLDISTVDLVTLQRAPSTSEEARQWRFICETCAGRGIALEESTNSQRTGEPVQPGRAKATPAKPRATTTKRPRTKIGRTIFNNSQQLALSSASLLLMIDEKIASLRAQRPNSDQAIRERGLEIAHYETIYKALSELRLASEELPATEREEKAVASAKTFAEGVQSWWTKRHVQICELGFETGLFLSAVSICSLVGAGGLMSVVISGALVGGKPVVDAIKSIQKSFSKGFTNKE